MHIVIHASIEFRTSGVMDDVGMNKVQKFRLNGVGKTKWKEESRERRTTKPASTYNCFSSYSSGVNKHKCKR